MAALARDVINALILARKARDLPLKTLAARIGVDRTTLIRWERRKADPRLSSLIAWAQELGFEGVDLKVNRGNTG